MVSEFTKININSRWNAFITEFYRSVSTEWIKDRLFDSLGFFFSKDIESQWRCHKRWRNDQQMAIEKLPETHRTLSRNNIKYENLLQIPAVNKYDFSSLIREAVGAPRLKAFRKTGKHKEKDFLQSIFYKSTEHI